MKLTIVKRGEVLASGVQGMLIEAVPLVPGGSCCTCDCCCSTCSSCAVASTVAENQSR